MKIQQSWQTKNANTESATKIVESFFASKNFSSKTKEKKQEYQIIASGPNDKGEYVRIDARVFSEQDKLSVELSAGEGPLTNMSPLTNMLFGGYATIKAAKSLEMLNKLEQEFFTYVGERIVNLNSQNT